MSIKSVFVGPFFEPEIDFIKPAQSLMDFAIALARVYQAHLTIAVGSCAYSIPSAAIVSQARDIVAAANRERREKVSQLGEGWRKDAAAAGVVASLEFSHHTYPTVEAELCRRARASDIIAMQPSDRSFSLMQSVLEEMLFNTGRPVLIVPPAWPGGAHVKTVLIAWDGSARAARALGDALPFIETAEQIEIVSVSGDPNPSKRIDGADIAPHVARHNKSVQITNLPCLDGDVAQVLANHASLTRASLVVMGAYGHSKLREFILGGVTRTMITNPPVPTLMSY
jgi:nucleotide-binding universal stress UspA family protein